MATTRKCHGLVQESHPHRHRHLAVHMVGYQRSAVYYELLKLNETVTEDVHRRQFNKFNDVLLQKKIA